MNWIRRKLLEIAYPTYEECGPIELLILQPTEFCNIDCTYCYLRNRNSRSRMSEETIDASYRLAIESGLANGPLTIAWHAGEPLTAGLPFYRTAVEKFKSLAPIGLDYRHSIQTNAMLINDEWAAFFKEHDIRVGVSVDGPSFIHDVNRVTRRGGGTHAAAMQGISYLQKHGVEFHTISVLTRQSLSFPREILDFLISIGSTYICFNVEEIESHNISSSLSPNDGLDAKDACRAFFAELMHEVGRAKQPVRVREIDGALSAIAGWRGQARGVIVGNSQQTHPFKIISVDHQGGFSSYSPELLGESFGEYQSFELGNVHLNSLRDGYESPLFRRLYTDIQRGIDICRKSCGYYQMCGGGTPANKLFENGSFVSSTTMFCEMHRKAPIDAALGAFTAV
ncbi:GRRM system radical SAM/SPASM domain protein [Rhizobium laguerreae]|uniref:cyclophane-forming radical SAM/SPASM peptide maturase GrrM/OscB n=1 Tax=Rhizobium laguerreae TaxID=1076926 RepID=UPI0014792A19|nr:cyclophane-forming radical SAM/SPASM peptide maturase GrrM/OscB [Rhizobium laguerreae]NNG70096.1 GRRM system radical SAM/SPASM domain protein [Rhizobium laguerreae]